jgi:methyltransferase (TIGR00027 family)
MKYRRFDSQEEGLLFEVPWETDRQYRMDPGVMTAFLREQVPVLDHVGWNILDIEPGGAETVLPLNAQSTNQHFTHQAALFLLSADYTGGLAVSSLIMGWPIVGVHPVTSSKSISLWLVKGEIKYLRPSVGDLRAKACIEPERHRRIRRRFLDGKAVLEAVNVDFFNGTEKVAESTLTYFMRQTEKLRGDDATPDKANILHQLKLTSSAEMIAGVRARTSGNLFEDPYAAEMAGQHGMAVATRFCEKTPQLGGMVAARTRHLDDEIEEFCARGGRNIVLLGVGWDMRAFRLSLPEFTRVFELDLPCTLQERCRRIERLGLKTDPGVERVCLPIDARTTQLACALKPHLDFQSPVLVACEGLLMYFQEQEVRRILRGIAPVVEHADSRLWFDFVERAAVERPDTHSPEVAAFMRGMQILGEPFTFGMDNIEQFMSSVGYRCHRVAPSNVFFDDKSDAVYRVYRFCVASSVPAAVASSEAEYWTIHAGDQLGAPALVRLESDVADQAAGIAGTEAFGIPQPQ